MATFNPSVSKTGRVPVHVTPGGLPCQLELYLGLNKAATSGPISFNSTGSSQDVDCPIIMPAAAGTYHVYLDLTIAASQVLQYIGTEDVVIAAANNPLIFGTPVNAGYVDDPQGSAYQGVDLRVTVSNQTSAPITRLISCLFGGYYSAANGGGKAPGTYNRQMANGANSISVTVQPGGNATIVSPGIAPAGNFAQPPSPNIGARDYVFFQDDLGNKSPEINIPG